eukprot:PLAT233.4.p1 GENE.PLAT233.4~~PLAT233.4.p1  ORF type:complete len:452 (+),score=195.27 PLAT233.4:55-1410(+)
MATELETLDDSTASSLLWGLAYGGDWETTLSMAKSLNVPADEVVQLRQEGTGFTLLHAFARCGSVDGCSALLRLGAFVDSRDGQFRSPLHLACRADFCPEGVSPLPVIRLLLRSGARVTARDSTGLTALHHAAAGGRDAVVVFLLDLNRQLRLPRAPLEAVSNEEDRPLHLAAMGGHTSTVRLLLKHGARKDESNYLGRTALHLAVLACNAVADAGLATVELLLSKRWAVDFTAVDVAGQTALHHAAASGNLAAVKVLLRAPPTVRRAGSRTMPLQPRDRAGATPADLAEESGWDDIVTLLRSAVDEEASMAELTATMAKLGVVASSKSSVITPAMVAAAAVEESARAAAGVPEVLLEEDEEEDEGEIDVTLPRTSPAKRKPRGRQAAAAAAAAAGAGVEERKDGEATGAGKRTVAEEVEAAAPPDDSMVYVGGMWLAKDAVDDYRDSTRA